jgi:zinc transport system substrate-binding protein
MRILATLCLLPLPAMAQVPLVVTDIPPVHALVSQVMGDLGSPVLLLSPGADAHEFQLRPSQMQNIQDAGLIIWIGPALTPWLARAAQSTKAPMLGLLEAPDTKIQTYLTDQDDKHSDGAADQDHDHAGVDPHAWLNPENAVLWLPLIAAELARADPDNAARYTANADAAVQRTKALDAEVAALLAPVASAPLVTYHNAYGYFVSQYGLAYAGAIADGEAAEPGAAHLVAMQAHLSKANVRCLFPEIQHDPALAAQLLGHADTRLGGALDPVGSSLEPGPMAYDALIRAIAMTLVDCLKT